MTNSTIQNPLRATRRQWFTPFAATATATAAIACVSSSALAQSSTRYRVVPLPTPEGASGMDAAGLNNSNEVTGSVNINTQVRPYLYADGHTTILDEVEGIYTSGMAVNDRGHVAGWMYEWGVIWPQAFLWDGTTNHWLVDPDESLSYAQGVNDRDQVVGFYYPPNGHPNGNAFVVTNGTYHDLGAGEATDITPNGIIVGQYERSFGLTAVWTPDGHGGWTRETLEGRLATAINDDGTMFCGSGPSSAYFDTAAVWTDEDGQWVRTDIGGWDPNQTNSNSNDVNNLGQVVGDYHAFFDSDKGWIFESGEVTWLSDLLTPAFSGWEVTRALAINEAGVILANAQPKGQSFAQPVLLIPDALTILGPRGDGAGSTNELIAVSATRGSRIYFAVGFATGSLEVPGCPGVNVGVAAPRVVGSAVANGDREARLPVFVPAAGAGRTIYLQAIDRSHCQVSNVLRYTLH